MVKVRATSLRARARRGDARAKLAQSVVGRLDRYLSVTQFGITLASLGLGWIGEPALARIGDSVAEELTGHAMGRAAHAGIDALAFGVLTFAHVLLGELVPKLVAI